MIRNIHTFVLHGVKNIQEFISQGKEEKETTLIDIMALKLMWFCYEKHFL